MITGYQCYRGGKRTNREGAETYLGSMRGWHRERGKGGDEMMDYPETVPLRDPSHNQPPNPDTIAYARKILLKGP